MTRLSIVVREKKRAKLESRFRVKRSELKKLAQESFVKGEIPWEIQQKLQALPKNSHPTRKRRRCRLCGRPRGVYQRFGMCRCCLRKFAMQGMVPGIVKASW